MKKFHFSAIIVLLIALAEVRSQTAEKVEVGAQFTSFTLPASQYYGVTEPGFGGRITYNINDNLALEEKPIFSLIRMSSPI